MTMLWKQAGRPVLPLVLTGWAAVALARGLSEPVVTLRRGLARDSYSVLTGIVDLARSDEVLLALIVFAFSVVFPITKLCTLGLVLFREVPEERRGRLLRTLGLLGRWSMLDVFVVAILIGSVHLGMISEAWAEPGIYVFASGILLSMFATVSIERIVRGDHPRKRAVPAARPLERWTSLLALALFAVGLELPLIVVEKFRYWDHEYSVLAASTRMLDEGEYLLGAAVLFFVVLLPLARLVGIAFLRWGRPGERTVQVVLELEKWAMLDVFGLALLVVVAKIGTVASVEIRIGFWILLAAAALSLYDTWALRREGAS